MGERTLCFCIGLLVGAEVGVSRTAMTLLIKSGLLCSPQIVDSLRAVSSRSSDEIFGLACEHASCWRLWLSSSLAQ